MFRLGKHEWIIPTALIVAGAVGLGVIANGQRHALKRDYVGLKQT
jgi:hypothetical protein